MIISNSRQYVFVHLHKTGGSSLEIAIEPTLQWNDLLLGSTNYGESANMHYMSRYGLDKHSSIETIIRSTNHVVERYQFFTIVRHPIKRALSLYRFVNTLVDDYCHSMGFTIDYVHNNYESLKTQYWPLCWPASIAFISSKGDLNDFFISESLNADSAVCTQHSQLSLGGSLFPGLTVIRLEELSNAGSTIANIVGSQLSIPHENKSTSKSVSISDLDSKTLAHLNSLYAIDFCSFYQ